jgi:Mlc titration factor MtfA (ptsG expression regulator)
MSDDPKKTGLDRKLIAMNEPHEVRRWTEALHVTEQQLRDAVDAVGNSADAVRVYLAKQP